VKAVLRRSCYDCHSNETSWPWYSRVAPVSWLVASDVHEGREKLNFSAWSRLRPDKRERVIEEVWEEVREGEMPLPVYLLAHRGARLSAENRDVIRAWAGTKDGAPTREPAGSDP